MGWCPELTSLKLLVEVAASGSITEAARREGVSQPAASKRIRALERSMGVTLIERTPAGSRLTPEGGVVVDWASRVFDTVEQMFDAVASMREHASPDLTLAASMTIAEHLVPSWLSALRASVPDLHVSLQVTNSQDVQRLVQEGKADIGLVESATVDGRLESRLLSHDRLTVAVAATHPWAGRDAPLSREELANAQSIVREVGSGTREVLDRWLDSLQRAEPLVELGSNAAVKGAVKAGVGPAVLSLLAVQDELRSGELVEVMVSDVDPKRPLFAVWRRGRALDMPSAALVQIASEYSSMSGTAL
jgi:molybdate transport repressor ModE-like protein